MQAGERVAEAIDAAAGAMTKANVEGVLANAARAISRALALPSLNGEASGSDLAVRVRASGEALERALIEAGEARAALDGGVLGLRIFPGSAGSLRSAVVRAAGGGAQA